MSNRDLARRKRELVAELGSLTAAEELALLDDRLLQKSDGAFVLLMKIMKAQRLFDAGREEESICLIDECSRSPDADEFAQVFPGGLCPGIIREG